MKHHIAIMTRPQPVDDFYQSRLFAVLLALTIALGFWTLCLLILDLRAMEQQAIFAMV